MQWPDQVHGTQISRGQEAEIREFVKAYDPYSIAVKKYDNVLTKKV